MNIDKNSWKLTISGDRLSEIELIGMICRCREANVCSVGVGFDLTVEVKP